jgi:hypothetical protein
MIPRFDAWHGKVLPWPRAELDSYLAFLYQLVPDRWYPVASVHKVAQQLKWSRHRSVENLSCWCDIGIVKLSEDEQQVMLDGSFPTVSSAVCSTVSASARRSVSPPAARTDCCQDS